MPVPDWDHTKASVGTHSTPSDDPPFVSGVRHQLIPRSWRSVLFPEEVCGQPPSEENHSRRQDGDTPVFSDEHQRDPSNYHQRRQDEHGHHERRLQPFHVFVFAKFRILVLVPVDIASYLAQQRAVSLHRDGTG
jgi:hypothetical protein